MAFRELAEKLKLPTGASSRYRQLEALSRMLDGTLYDDLPLAFEEEKKNGKYVPLRERRPSTTFNLAYEITQDTLAELFGDEAFPSVKIAVDRTPSDPAEGEIGHLIEELNLESVCADAYEAGVVGSVAIVLHRSDNGLPFYDILPGNWCEPQYRSEYSNELLALVVTYPVDRKTVEDDFPDIVKKTPTDTYWYRYIIGPYETVDYEPLADTSFARLGELDAQGNRIAFSERARNEHGFSGRVPAIFVKNLGGRPRKIDGPGLWWPIRDICVEIDYTLSQCGRGLRYCSDPMLFLKRGDLINQADDDPPAGYTKTPGGGMATEIGAHGEMVRGATQVLVGGKDSDAKILEITGQGIAEERQFIQDLREYALEVVGGMKARAEHLKSAPSGTALDKGLKPLRRLVRRQRRPYGNNMLLPLLALTLHGFREKLFDATPLDVNLDLIPVNGRMTLEWPNDDTLQGQELLWHVSGLQLAAGGSTKAPKELMAPDAIGAKLALDLGFHQPYATIKGDADEDEATPNSPLVTP